MNYLKKSAVCIAAALLAANSFGVMPYNPIELSAITANAADIVDSGECGAEGDNLTWTFDSEGTLTISGEGAMVDDPYWGVTNITKVVIENGVTSIGEFAFGYCRNLTSVIISDSVTSIGDIAFECCSNLNSITIPDSVTSIGQGAFKWCQSLVSVTLPNNITCIEDYTFDACEKLTSITIPSNVTTIGGSAFSGCNITSITLPDKVSNIGTWAFWRCEALNSITINNPECEICDEDGTIANGYNDEVYFNGTIYGYANSTAQAYAEKYNRKFVALEEKPTAELGDVNEDGTIDASDASLVLAEYARIQTGGAGEFTESQLKAADVNNDDVVDSSDASKILAYYAMISTGKEPEWD